MTERSEVAVCGPTDAAHQPLPWRLTQGQHKQQKTHLETANDASGSKADTRHLLKCIRWLHPLLRSAKPDTAHKDTQTHVNLNVQTTRIRFTDARNPFAIYITRSAETNQQTAPIP